MSLPCRHGRSWTGLSLAVASSGAHFELMASIYEAIDNKSPQWWLLHKRSHCSRQLKLNQAVTKQSAEC
jgi:hypothetical protein